jgi:hypothetical protein
MKAKVVVQFVIVSLLPVALTQAQDKVRSLAQDYVQVFRSPDQGL